MHLGCDHDYMVAHCDGDDGGGGDVVFLGDDDGDGNSLCDHDDYLFSKILLYLQVLYLMRIAFVC